MAPGEEGRRAQFSKERAQCPFGFAQGKAAPDNELVMQMMALKNLNESG